MSKLDDFEEALVEVRSAPFDPTVLSLLSGPMLKMVAAWPMVKTWVEPAQYVGAMPEAWAMTHFDFKEWAALAGGLDQFYVANNWLTLALTNVIYPDNTMPEQVKNLLKSRFGAPTNS